MEENENENENENSRKLNPISMKIIMSSHADPLFSSIVTLYILILLYSPHIIFSKIILSPVLIITFTLLLTLLRLGATQRNERAENTESNCTDNNSEAADHETTSSTSSYIPHQDHKGVTCTDSNFGPNPFFENSFVEWNVRAPLEVIYEAYEGEEDDEETVKDPGNKGPFCVDKYASLSLYYPETDSDTSSDGCDRDRGSPESVCYRWEDEDREGLIEIALDNNNSRNNKRERLYFENFHGEEENNLIEIDISPARDGEKFRFPGEW